MAFDGERFGLLVAALIDVQIDVSCGVGALLFLQLELRERVDGRKLGLEFGSASIAMASLRYGDRAGADFLFPLFAFERRYSAKAFA